LIKYIIDNHRSKVELDCRMQDDWTPFFYAAVNGYMLTAEVLAKHGKCKVNAVDKLNRTALHWAARYNNRAMVKLLLDLGVKPDAIDIEGLTAYELAKS